MSSLVESGEIGFFTNNAPAVSVIVLNWNGAQRVMKCLEHIFAQSYMNVEVIIVDNASVDGSMKEISQKYSGKLQTICNDHNLGFAEGMNVGFRKCRGDYILFLNDDMFLHKDFVAWSVEEILKEKDNNVKTGMIAGNIFKYSKGEYSNEEDSRGVMMLPFHSLVGSRRNERGYILGPSGAAIMVSREMLEDVALENGDVFERDYFAYGEDIELYLRSHLMGWKCLYVPKTIGWTIGSASVGGGRRINEKPAKSQFLSLRNRYVTVASIYTWFDLRGKIFMIVVGDLGYFLGNLLKLRFKNVYIQFKAMISACRMSKKIKIKRKWMRERKRLMRFEGPTVYANLTFIGSFLAMLRK